MTLSDVMIIACSCMYLTWRHVVMTSPTSVPIFFSMGFVTLMYEVTRQGYSVGLCCIEFPDPKNHGNKKSSSLCSVSTTRYRKGPIQGHVTLTYKVTRQGYSVGLCCIRGQWVRQYTLWVRRLNVTQAECQAGCHAGWILMFINN